MISKKTIQQFKEIYKSVFNEELSNEEAFDKANNLLNLYKAIYENKNLTALEKKYEVIRKGLKKDKG